MAITQEQIDKAIEMAKEYGATRLLLFGSALTDPENANDLDLAVDGLEGLDFFIYGGKLESIINASVDIVTLTPENRFIRHIKRVGKFIYDTTNAAN